MSQLRVFGFRGMNNTQRNAVPFTDRDGVATPQLLLNSYVTSDGAVVKRTGYRKLYALAGAKCLWAGSVALCVADGVLYRVREERAEAICAIAGSTLSYTEVGSRIYMTNPKWRGIYDAVTNTVSAWGMDVPPAPKLSPTTGGLPPGTYHVRCTRLIGEAMSGASSPGVITFGGDGGGIAVSGLPTGAVVWVTEPNQRLFFHAAELPIQRPVFGMPLPTLNVVPPPFMSTATFAYGRIWGAEDTKLVYSEPFHYDWFKVDDRGNRIGFDLGVQILEVLYGQQRLYARTARGTWVFRGTDPAKMELEKVSEGGGPTGNSIYGQLLQQGTEIAAPIWVERNGVLVGLPDTNPTNITFGHVKDVSGEHFSGLVRRVNGEQMVLVTIGRETADEITEIVQRGRVFGSAPLDITGAGGVSIQ